ncbi:MAG: hypothetical protein BGN86_07465 [Caulobacterales bacterium 68-7]|nr:hypothetical protein [Caulobacterales bacterium]OJU13018.1 MAG: hypothetical protein BGN86_07465 [Caulobacterales bacterium 68-7]
MKTSARFAVAALVAGLLAAPAAFAQDAMGRMQSNQTPNPMAGKMTSDKMAKPMTKEEKMAADKKMKADKMAMAKHDAMMKKDAMKKDSMAKKGAMSSGGMMKSDGKM